MSEVARIEHFELSQADIQVLADAGIVPNDTPVEQVEVFARVCREKGLSPFSGEIHLVSYNTKYGTIWARIVGIDGFRKRAAMTGESAGKDAPQFNVKSDGSFETLYDAKSSEKDPVSCRVTVYRIKQGVRVPYVGEVLFSEYAAKKWDKQSSQWVLSGNWKSMPFHMLAKCAEAMAYKAGFADELSGLHIPEEQGAFENEGSDVELSDEKISKRAELLNEIREKIKGMTLEESKAYYRKHPQWRTDDSITNIFIEHAETIKNDG